MCYENNLLAKNNMHVGIRATLGRSRRPRQRQDRNQHYLLRGSPRRHQGGDAENVRFCLQGKRCRLGLRYILTLRLRVAIRAPESGGLLTHQLLRMVRSFKMNVVGCDVVEGGAAYDHAGVTSILAANLTAELVAIMGHARDTFE